MCFSYLVTLPGIVIPQKTSFLLRCLDFSDMHEVCPATLLIISSSFKYHHPSLFFHLLLEMKWNEFIFVF